MADRPVQPVIFDMDGVIFDSERLLMESWKVVAARHGIAGIEETLRLCFGLSVDVSRHIYFDRYGPDFPLDQYKAEAAELFWASCSGGHPPVKAGARDLLLFLHQWRVPLALASSTRREVVHTELKNAGLLAYFQVVIGGDQIARGKPHPDIFLEAARALGAHPSDCFVIEDSHNGIRAAWAAGTKALMVPDMVPPNDEMTGKATAILPSLDAVKAYLTRQLEGNQAPQPANERKEPQ